MTPLRITILVENTAKGRGVRGEHGLAFWIEAGNRRILFDTGQTPDVLLHNADCLGIKLFSVDTVVLSHGHYDHTGGLAKLLGTETLTRLFLNPAALQRRYSRHRDGSTLDVGIPHDHNEQSLQRSATIAWTEQPTEILPGMHVTGEVPRDNDYEDTGGDFFLDESCAHPDPIIDDQAVYLDTTDGTVVLLGCAHAGVINTLEHIQDQTGGRPIHAVIGGMHLVHASPRRLDRTVEALRRFDLKLLAPGHCTGPQASARLWSEFSSIWQPCPVGTQFEFRLSRIS